MRRIELVTSESADNVVFFVASIVSRYGQLLIQSDESKLPSVRQIARIASVFSVR